MERESGGHVGTRDEHKPVRRFGFAYGTLADHVESGEERFVIEWDQGDDTVWYDILAFSRPRHLLARLGYLLVRRFQKRFAWGSAAAMQRAVDSSGIGGGAGANVLNSGPGNRENRKQKTIRLMDEADGAKQSAFSFKPGCRA